MTTFTDGRLETYERMMQHRNYYREYPGDDVRAEAKRFKDKKQKEKDGRKNERNKG